MVEEAQVAKISNLFSLRPPTKIRGASSVFFIVLKGFSLSDKRSSPSSELWPLNDSLDCLGGR